MKATVINSHVFNQDPVVSDDRCMVCGQTVKDSNLTTCTAEAQLKKLQAVWPESVEIVPGPQTKEV